MSNMLKPPVKCTTRSPHASPQAANEQCSPSVQALRLAKLRIGASAADIASWCEVHRSTVERWLSGTQRIQLEAVTRSRRLYPVFSECLDEVLGRRAA